MFLWQKKAIPVLLTSIILTACSSDDDATPIQIDSGAGVSLKERRSATINDAKASGDGDLSISWSQVSGPAITFSDTKVIHPVVTASSVDADGQAILRLTVIDSKGQTATDDVTLTILNNTLPEISTTTASIREKAASTLQVTTVDDGTVSSVRWEQTSGPILALTGADSATISFNSPAVTKATTVNFMVYATDDDAETSSKELAVVIEPNLSTFVLTGQVDGADFSAGKASLTGAAEELTTDISSAGVFSFNVQLDDDLLNSVVTVTTTAATNSQLKYAAVYSGFSAAVSTPVSVLRAKVQTTLADEKNYKVSVNAVSTALYSLLLSANEGVVPENIEKLTFIEKSVDADELMNAAAIVKIMTENNNFSLPEGVTDLVALLTNVDAYNQLFDEITAASPTLISDTIVAIANDPVLTPPVDASQLPQFYYETFAAADGFLSRSGARWNFESNGSGFLTSYTGHFPFNWRIDGNKIKIIYDETNPPYTLSRNVYISVNGNTGITQQHYNWLIADKKHPVDVHYATLESELTRVTTGSSVDTYRVINKVQPQIRPIQTTSGIVESKGAIAERTGNILMRREISIDTVFTADEMPGTWAINSYFTEPFQKRETTGFFLDLLEFKSDGSGSGLNTGRTFGWSIVDGELNLAFSDQTKLTVKIIDQSGTDLQLFTLVKDEEDQIIAAEADYGFKVDTTTLAESIANKEGHYWQSMINSTDTDSWDGNRLVYCTGDPLCKDKEYYFTPLFGWELNSDNKGNQITDPWPDNAFPPLHVLGTTPITWIYSTPNQVTIRYTSVTREKTVLKQEQGVLGRRLYVREKSSSTISGTTVQPRINIYEEISKSYWNDTAPEAATPLSLQSYLQNNLTKSKPAQRKVVQHTEAVTRL